MGAATTKMLHRIRAATPDFDEAIEAVFKKADRDNNGQLDHDEFDELVEQLGKYVSDLIANSGGRWQTQELAKSFVNLTVTNEKREKDALFAQIDGDGSQGISFEELRTHIYKVMESGETPSPKSKKKGVFDRLQDEEGYTGTHVNHHEQAANHTNAAVEKSGTGHAKNFSDAPVTKFGLQVDKPIQFMCWNGLDKHAQPKKITMSNIRTMEQLVSKCTQACSVSPQPKFLTTPKGKPVKSLEQIEDGEHYIIIQSGATYKVDSLPTALREIMKSSASARPTSAAQKKMKDMDDSLFASASPGKVPKSPGGSDITSRLTDPSKYTGTHVNHNEAKIDKTNKAVEKSATGHAKNFGDAPVQKFGLQGDKPIAFFCWNGLDKHAQGQKVLTSNIRTFEQLVSKCTQVCNVSPQPTYLHTPAGKPVKSLEQIVDGAHYLVIQSGAKYNKASLPTALPK